MPHVIAGWLKNIETVYCVNPWIFAFIYVITIPPFWYSVYKIVIGLKKGSGRSPANKLLKWFFLLGFTLLAPFLYVAFFGKNLPYWFWIVIAVFLAFSTLSVIKKIR